MICDVMENLERYRGISRNFSTAVDYLMKTDLNSLPLGKTEIDGKRVFLSIQEPVLHPLTEESYEIHRNYMDIQICLRGTEEIAFAVSGAQPLEEYNPESDFQRVKAEAAAACTLRPGRFVVCMLREAHAPCGGTGENGSVRKCVVKVARDDFGAPAGK